MNSYDAKIGMQVWGVDDRAAAHADVFINPGEVIADPAYGPAIRWSNGHVNFNFRVAHVSLESAQQAVAAHNAIAAELRAKHNSPAARTARTAKRAAAAKRAERRAIKREWLMCPLDDAGPDPAPEISAAECICN